MIRILFFSVRRPLECATTAGQSLVRRSSRFPSQEHGPSSVRDRQNRDAVSILLDRLHFGASFRGGTDDAEAIHQVHLSFRLIYHVFE